MSVFIPIAKKGNAKECSNYCTIAFISHASKVMLKFLQARCSSWIQKRQRNQRSNCQHLLDRRKSKRVPEKHHGFMVSGPITSWQIDGETMEAVRDFVFLSSKITVDGDCSHEIKRHFLLGRKAMTNLDNILQSRNITLPTKICLVKAMIFPVVMYGCESWTIKKVEH